VGRRSLVSDAHADPMISSVLDVRWAARLEGLASNMSTRVPFPKEKLPAPSITVLDSDDRDDTRPEAASMSATTTEAAGSVDMTANASATTTTTPGTQSQSGEAGTSLGRTTRKAEDDVFSRACDVFTAKERVPLASAWGIEDCSATLSSAFGALAQTLQERPGDGESALRLYAHNKTLISLVRIRSNRSYLSCAQR
jgi:hypothetical protein